MGKQTLAQRYCYKINSDYIKRNKGDVKITNIRSAIKNRLIVGIGDSTGTRMIREIIKSPYNEEYIDNIKYKIKQINKSLRNGDGDKKNLKKVIKKLNDELLTASLQDCICNVVFDNNKDYEKYSQDGFRLNGKKYILLLGTPGGIKLNTVLFVREDVYEEISRRIDNGADFSIAMLPSKLMAYKALTFSSSVPVTFTPNILVVEDVEVAFNDTVIYIKFPDDKIAPTVETLEDYEVVNNACDGCGLIMPHLMEVWGKQDLGLDYTPSGVVVRNSWIKGVLTSFDFRAYVNYRDDMRGKKVKDVWGKEWDINDVDIIMNRSMFKLSKHYKSMEHYLENCKENGYGFSITKFVHKHIDNERMLNYQYIQCLDLSDEDIDTLLKGDIDCINDITGNDYKKTILYGKGKDLTEKNVWFSKTTDDVHIKALMINPYAINDEFVKDKIRRSISKRIDLLKTGKINVKGNYQIAIGEPIIQLESAFGLEPKGILKANEFYIEYWRSKGVDRVGAFRSPMSCKQNAKVMNVSHKEEAIRWYGEINNMIIFNAFDTTMSAMNGEDFDGDINFTTSNPIITDGIFDDLPTIFCEGKSSSKMANPKKEDFIKAIKDGFGNRVGSVTNFGSSCYDKISLFEKGSKEYEEIDYRIMCIQYLQQECIDSAKNGLPPRPIPSFWNNGKCEELNIWEDEEEGVLKNLSDEEFEFIEFNKRILTDKKPYYFRYIYQESDRQYRSFIKEMEEKALKLFGKSLSEVMNEENKSNAEIEFMDKYNRLIPLSNNPCIINKIANKVENEFSKTSKYSKRCKDFNYGIYQYRDVEEKASKRQIEAIKELYEEYKIINAVKKNNLASNKDEGLNNTTLIIEQLSMEVREIIINEKVLVNTLIEMAYAKSKITPSFVWMLIGDLILDCMLSKTEGKISFPKRDENGDIVFGGEKFKMKTIMIKGDEV